MKWSPPLTLNDLIKDVVFEELPNSREDFKLWLQNKYLNLDHETIERWSLELYDCGPLQNLLNDPAVTEVIAQGHESIVYEKHGQLQQYEDQFLSPLTFRNFIFRLMQEAQMRTDFQQPCSDGQWRSFRVHLIQKPLVPYEFHLTLRRQQPEAFKLETLLKKEMISPEQKFQLECIVKQKKNALIVGPTGSGKTTVLNALLQEADSDRIIALEDTTELKMPNTKSVALLTRYDSQGHLKNFDLSDLLRQSLRMRPERLVVGEIRGSEATQLLMALATGHSGSFGTLHAEDPHQALLRLEMLTQMGAPQWTLQSIRQLIYESVDLIIVVGMENAIDENNTKKRRLKGIFEITSLEPHGFLLEPFRTLKTTQPHLQKYQAVQIL